jgi:uncharacterized protein (DUF2336 family)
MLTQAHVRALRDNPSPTVRAEVAAAVGAELASAALDAREAAIAAQILEFLAHDVELAVRQALAEHIKECPFLPPDIALMLARDIEDQVALPILEYSPVLDDAELIAFVRQGATARQLAIARRKSIGSAVADALVDTAKREVVSAVLANRGATIEEAALHQIAGQFSGDDAIAALLVDRPSLPLTVCEMLIANLSAALRDRLVVQHQIPAFLAEELALHGRERALVKLMPGQDGNAAERLAAHLHAKRRLTPSLVLRSISLGDLGFFDAAMAALADIPTMSARTLLYDRGAGGLRGIYDAARLPPELFRAFRAAISAVLEGHLKQGHAAFAEHLLGQLVRLYDDLSPTSLEHAIAQLARRAGPAGGAAEP